MTIEQKFFLMYRFHSRKECGGESPLEHPAPWMGGDRASFGRDGSRLSACGTSFSPHSQYREPLQAFLPL